MISNQGFDPLYSRLPPISQNFINEVDFRVRSAQQALEILALFQSKGRKHLPEARSIRFMAARFAVIELSALLDGSGVYAIKLHRPKGKGKYSLQVSCLKRIFPTLSPTQIAPIERDLSLLIEMNSGLIHRLLHTRHKRLAHAGVPRYIVDPESITSAKFPKARFDALAGGLWNIFIPFALGLPRQGRT